MARRGRQFGVDDIFGHCRFAWNKLTDQPWHISSIGLRDWAYRS
jgi:hypothetical protein